MLKILILEDYPPLSRALEILLQQTGYHVTPTQTVEEALRMSGHHVYDLFVIDMDVRNVDFRCFIEELQALQCHPPVLAFLSPLSYWAHNVTGMGVQIVLYKPIGRQALHMGIEMSLKNQTERSLDNGDPY